MPFRLPAWDELPDFGLYMDQLMTCAARWAGGCAPLTSGMINSYVKLGLMDRPEAKKYSRAALSQLLMICHLKQTSSLETLRRLLHPAGGDAETVYAAFRAEQERLLSQPVSADIPPLVLALRAAACQRLCEEALGERV